MAIAPISRCTCDHPHLLRPLMRLMLAASALALAACTSQPLQGSYVVPTTDCCATLAEYAFKPLPLGQETDVSLTATSPTLALNGQRGHFVGFSIPPGVIASAVSVKTYLSSDFLPKATAVAPQFHFFDARFQPLAKVAVTDMQSEGGFWRSAVSGRVAVPSDTRYIVLMASRGEAWRAVVRSENGTQYRLPPAALGDLSVRLFGERTSGQ